MLSDLQRWLFNLNFWRLTQVLSYIVYAQRSAVRKRRSQHRVSVSCVGCEASLCAAKVLYQDGQWPFHRIVLPSIIRIRAVTCA